MRPFSRHSRRRHPERCPPPNRPADVLADRAAATADVHAIKLTEACLRLYAESPEPELPHAAARASQLLG